MEYLADDASPKNKKLLRGTPKAGRSMGLMRPAKPRPPEKQTDAAAAEKDAISTGQDALKSTPRPDSTLMAQYTNQQQGNPELNFTSDSPESMAPVLPIGTTATDTAYQGTPMLPGLSPSLNPLLTPGGRIFSRLSFGQVASTPGHYFSSEPGSGRLEPAGWEGYTSCSKPGSAFIARWMETGTPATADSAPGGSRAGNNKRPKESPPSRDIDKPASHGAALEGLACGHGQTTGGKPPHKLQQVVHIECTQTQEQQLQTSQDSFKEQQLRRVLFDDQDAETPTGAAACEQVAAETATEAGSVSSASLGSSKAAAAVVSKDTAVPAELATCGVPASILAASAVGVISNGNDQASMQLLAGTAAASTTSSTIDAPAAPVNNNAMFPANISAACTIPASSCLQAVHEPDGSGANQAVEPTIAANGVSHEAKPALGSPSAPLAGTASPAPAADQPLSSPQELARSAAEAELRRAVTAAVERYEAAIMASTAAAGGTAGIACSPCTTSLGNQEAQRSKPVLQEPHPTTSRVPAEAAQSAPVQPSSQLLPVTSAIRNISLTNIPEDEPLLHIQTCYAAGPTAAHQMLELHNVVTAPAPATVPLVLPAESVSQLEAALTATSPAAAISPGISSVMQMSPCRLPFNSSISSSDNQAEHTDTAAVKSMSVSVPQSGLVSSVQKQLASAEAVQVNRAVLTGCAAVSSPRVPDAFAPEAGDVWYLPGQDVAYQQVPAAGVAADAAAAVATMLAGALGKVNADEIAEAVAAMVASKLQQA